MKHQPGFLADILEGPDDNAPRLVYAEWLDDNGQSERAEFIRRQCELPSMPADHPQRQAKEKREKELREAHRKDWVGEVQVWAQKGAKFHRGFVAEVHATAKAFVSG